MGTRKWHIARAKHHHEVFGYLKGSYDDWALVTLFYSALHYVHSSLADEPDLPKDERNPRKHSGVQPGVRGVNQLVTTLYPPIDLPYKSLFELSLRTRYDISQLGPMTLPGAEMQWKQVRGFCEQLNSSRPWIPSQAK